MTKINIPQTIDDLDGSVIGAEGETIPFSVRGVDYLIDLSPQHVEEFDEALGRFIEVATRLKGRRAQRVAAAANRREYLRTVREWAAEEGYDLGVRGRIPQYVEQAYLESVAS